MIEPRKPKEDKSGWVELAHRYRRCLAIAKTEWKRAGFEVDEMPKEAVHALFIEACRKNLPGGNDA